MKPAPPRYAVRFLRWFCREESIEEIEGDLTELYEQETLRHTGYARLKFVLRMLRYFRPEFMKSFARTSSLISTGMIYHNLLISFRNFLRHKSSFFINLTGLSTGLACVLLIYFWVQDERSMDKFHERDASLYTILSTHPNGEGVDTWWEVPLPLVTAIAEDMPEIELGSGTSGAAPGFDVSSGGKHFRSSGQLADRNYFRLFSYPFAEGDPATALDDKSSIVLSETLAANLFGAGHSPMGKHVEWEFRGMKKSLQVTGVFRDIKENSSEQFDFVMSDAIFTEIIGQGATWGNFHAKYYFALRADADPVAFAAKIKDYLKVKDKGTISTLLLQKYSDRYLYNNYTNGVQAGGRIEYVRLFSIVAIFIMGIACINFMNLSTARATRRIREVGIKKAIGAQRKSLIFQHLSESMLMTFISTLVAAGLVAALLPAFSVISGKHLHPEIGPAFLLVLFGMMLITGLVAGSYPAFYLSGFSPASVLKGNFRTGLGEAGIRKALVAFQFVLSVILIVSVIVVHNQIRLIQTVHLGYNRDNIIYFGMDGRVTEQPEAFLAEVRRIPGVVQASGMWGSMMGETGVTQGSFEWEGRDPNRQYSFSHLGVNYGLLEMLDIKMAEGRSFSKDFPGDTARIIINEAGIAAMGLKDPVGKTFSLWGNPMEIIGVAKDFNFRSVHEGVTPFFFRLMPRDMNKILIRTDGHDPLATTEAIRKLYKSFNPGFVFDYQYLDEQFQKQYDAEMRVSVLSRYFAGFAILISCLGLLGLAAFTAERRMREISIRKVLGSANWQIVSLLSRDFANIILISITIALPASYFLSKRWLENFAVRTELSWWIFAAAGLSTLLVSLVTVALITMRSARMNAVENLKVD